MKIPNTTKEELIADNSCGRCAHCADRHGSYRTNDGVCLLIGVTVRKSENSQICRPCGIKWSGEVMDFVPKGFEERDA